MVLTWSRRTERDFKPTGRGLVQKGQACGRRGVAFAEGGGNSCRSSTSNHNLKDPQKKDSKDLHLVKEEDGEGDDAPEGGTKAWLGAWLGLS